MGDKPFYKKSWFCYLTYEVTFTALETCALLSHKKSDSTINSHALRDELSWTHYCLLMRVENENAREFYTEEVIKLNWSIRQLERQINSFFYEGLLLSQNK